MIDAFPWHVHMIRSQQLLFASHQADRLVSYLLNLGSDSLELVQFILPQLFVCHVVILQLLKLHTELLQVVETQEN